MLKQEFSLSIGGKTLTLTFSDLAERADGSVLVRYGNSVILATAVMSPNPKEGSDFFPLTVDYEEKFYASGQILGSRFVRREGKPSDEAILSGRIVDRTIRPLFDQWIRNEVQVIITVLSVDEDAPDILGVIGTSLALATSSIPWNGPVSAVRLVKMKDDDNLIVNPNYKSRSDEDVELELVACGTGDSISMIELSANETSEETVIRALEVASAEIEKIQAFQKNIVAQLGRTKTTIPEPAPMPAIVELFDREIKPKLDSYVFSGAPGDTKIAELHSLWQFVILNEKIETDIAVADRFFEENVNRLVHTEAIERDRRADGRGLDQIRPLFAEAGGVSPTLHG